MTPPQGRLSRQRLWQLKKQAEGKCIICGKPRVTSHYCAEHADAQRDQRNARNEATRQNTCHRCGELGHYAKACRNR